MQAPRGRTLLGPSGRGFAGALLAGCAAVTGALGVVFAHQTRADGFDNAVDSPLIRLFAGHGNLLTWLAYPGTLVPAIVVSAAIAVWCLIAGRRSGAVLAVAAVPAATALDDELLKRLVGRTYLGALAFPSGHTTSAVALAAAVAVLLLAPSQQARTRTVRLLVVAVGCVVAAVVAMAVIALRWHYFTDTVAGAAVGIGTVCALALIIDYMREGFAVSIIQARTRASSRQAS